MNSHDALKALGAQLQDLWQDLPLEAEWSRDELTLIVPKAHWLTVAKALRDDFAFEQLMDVCAVDYLEYGCVEWDTSQATAQGFDRAVKQGEKRRVKTWEHPRFAVVYHLLSLERNLRLRVKCFLSEDDVLIDSAVPVWSSADWFEREAFDLMGIQFKGHPDLRRLLTDYGFVGHPFRKDFPLSGHVEVRYDAKAQKVVYEPVDIEPRVLVPRVIREDSRYDAEEETNHG